jgi:hypothetical protein
MKVSNFQEFLFESHDWLSIAKKASQSEELRELLNDCEEGKYPAIQVVPTPGADSYVAIAMGDKMISDVFLTDDPKVALTAVVMKNLDTKDPEKVANLLKDKEGLLQYSVFAGDRKPTPKEIQARFNVRFSDDVGNMTAYLTSTPIRKTYF